ncbi:MmgE/PrpD family protein [Rhizomonospora bruguierae]|uniref:MmgE/PrpD family protein n=1 Tax=Rhizomonospora bruguierae TaxID=1581705 RepID=UPI001BCEFD9F|nr:MmgE/PrpD family protein [Micromonospora sp. NBRC 107566]
MRTDLRTYVDAVQEWCRTPISDTEFGRAEELVVDTVGCALAGASEGVASRLHRAYAGQAGDSPTIGSAVRLVPEAALIVNGAVIRALDFNDVASYRNNTHPSEQVIPIALALGARSAWSGREFLAAVAYGYRIYLTTGQCWDGLLAKGWAPAATLGAISGAAFLSHLTDAEPDVFENAVAIAAATAPTLGAVFSGGISDTKSTASGMASRSAWAAFELARGGVRGPAGVFEAPGGFNTMVGGNFSAGAELLTCTDVTVKAFPAVFTAHAAIAAACEIAADDGWDPDAVTSMTVEVPPKVAASAAGPDRWSVTNRESAQFSLPLCVATALAHGRCGLAELGVNALNEPITQRFLRMMSVKEDQRWSGYLGGRVTVHRADGTTRTVEVETPPGHPSNPMAPSLLWDKFHSLTGGSGTEVEAALRSLTGASSLDELVRCVTTVADRT